MIKKKTINRKKLTDLLLSDIVKKGLLPYLVAESETKPPLNKIKPDSKTEPKVATRTLIQPSENIKLNWLLNKVIAAKNISELNEVVDRALDSDTSINIRNERNCSFAEAVVFKIYADKLQDKENKQESLMKKLMLRGAKFENNIIKRDKKTTEIYDKLQKEVKPQIDAQLKKLKAIGDNAAIKGNVTDVAIDNKKFYIEYSKSSIVNVAKVMEGTRNLGFNKGEVKLASNIIKFNDKGVEVKMHESGKRYRLASQQKIIQAV